MLLRTSSKGSSLVEVIVAAAIIVLVILSLVSAFLLHLRLGLGAVERVQAALLAEEGIEIVKFWRDAGWDSHISILSPNQNYFLFATSTTWEATTSPSLLLGTFSRTIRFSSVNRDTDGDIVTSGGSLDEGTRKVTVTVSWPSANGSTTKSISTYVADIFSN